MTTGKHGIYETRDKDAIEDIGRGNKPVVGEWTRLPVRVAGIVAWSGRVYGTGLLKADPGGEEEGKRRRRGREWRIAFVEGLGCLILYISTGFTQRRISQKFLGYSCPISSPPGQPGCTLSLAAVKAPS